ncbi:MAG: 2-(3-amino-3-carboxypropyl)histidine synthase [Methanonatronarchaeales archaeon]|nr:2-(3-amino-3-carboxypropyl)histidine synthase [Methanonatronarchaeales archaeon]
MEEVARRAREAVEERGAGTVALQLPGGLKRGAAAIAGELRDLGAEVVISGDPCFGACDPAPPDLEALGVDLVLHLGHSPMEFGTLPTVHLEVGPDVDVEPVVREAATLLGEAAGLVTTAQHTRSLERAAAILAEEGVVPEIADRGRRGTGPGQVLGCDLGNARVDAPELLYLGTGLFHPLGARLATGKRVVAADPSTGETVDLEEEVESFVRRRFGSVSAASDAETWGVLVGRKPGQRRLRKARESANLLEESGREANLVTLDLVTPEALTNLGMDAYVNTSCPRLSLDDGDRFDRPVLTPPELELMLGLTHEYRFDEFER